MKRLAIIVLLIIVSTSIKAQIHGDIYLNGKKLDTSKYHSVMSFMSFATRASFTASLDIGNGTNTGDNKFTDFQGNAIKFHSPMELILFMRENGYYEVDRFIQVTSLGAVMIIFYERNP